MSLSAYPRLHEAILFAAEMHRGQDRDGDHPLPYLTHPLEVLVNLRYTSDCTDEDLLVVAALHDLIEETEATPASIETRFGLRVRVLVEELTREEPSAERISGLSKDEVWRLRADMLLTEIGIMSSDAQRVKLADRLSNLREAKRTKSAPKLERYVKQTTRILEIIPRSVSPGLWDAIQAELP